MRVLVTDPGAKNSLAVVRDLARSGHEVHTLGAKLSLANWSSAVSESHGFPADVSFGASIVSLAEHKMIDCVVPVGAQSTFALDSFRHELAGVVAFALAPPEAMRLASSKKDTQDFSEEHGLFVPKSVVFSRYRSFINSALSFPLPFVVKSDSHLSSHGPLYVTTEEERERLITLELAAPIFLDGRVQIQEYIQGHGEGFFALYREGTCVRQMMHKRLGETPDSGGSSWAAQSIYAADTEFFGQRLLTVMKWHGPAMVEFKRRKSDGRLFLMELNPKLWGSLDLTISAGVRIPSDLVELAMGRQLRKDLCYDRGVFFWWPLDSWKSFFGRSMLKSSQKPRTNLDSLDLGPAIAGVLSLVRNTLLRITRTVGLNRFVAWWAYSGPAFAFFRLSDEVLGLPLRSNCEIDDFLWVGAQPRLLGNFVLRKILRRTCISLLRGDQSKRSPWKSEVKLVPITEFVEIPQAELISAVETLEQLSQAGKKAFVHCREGVGRAPSVAVAFLIYKGLPLGEALDKVMTGRRGTRINPLQMASLARFERSVRGGNLK